MRKLAILSIFLLAIVSFQTADASLTRVPKKPAPAPSQKTAKRTTHDHESTAPNSGNTGSTYLSAAQTCTVLNAVCQLYPECNMYTGSCNVVVKKTDQWCGDICYAESSDDCCEINPGPVAGIVIGIILFIVLSIVGCCACCGCCCFRKKEVVVVQAPSAST